MQSSDICGVKEVECSNPAETELATLAVTEMGRCFTDAQNDPNIGVIILTGGVDMLNHDSQHDHACSRQQAAYSHVCQI